MPMNTSRWIVRTSGAIIASLSSFRNGSSTFKSPSLPFLRLFNTHQHVQNAIVAHIINPHMQITAMAPRTSPGTVLCNTSLVQYDLTIKHTPSVTQSVIHSFMHAYNHSIIQSFNQSEAYRLERTSCRAGSFGPRPGWQPPRRGARRHTRE